MNKKWIIKSLPCQKKIEHLSTCLNTSSPISSLLLLKNIDSFEVAKSFFRPSLSNLYNPFLLKNMKIAVAHIVAAIKNKEKILLYGDYDVDGITSTCMMYDFMKSIGAKIFYYIPDRYSEGYGISEAGILWAKKNDINLMISLDCGIRANKVLDIASKQNIEVIITDHHQPGEVLPKAFAIVNPKQKDCKYPFKGLSGGGVAFKIIQAIVNNLSLSIDTAYQYLDFVAISTAADIVPMVDENRILTYFGLKYLEKTRRPGLVALKNLAGLRQDISVSDVVFGMAPLINSAGRIDHAHLGVSLMTEQDETKAHEYAANLHKKNVIRKDIDRAISQEAYDMIEKNCSKDNKSITLFKDNWHKGVIGIVASRCVEKYYKPTIIMANSDRTKRAEVDFKIPSPTFSEENQKITGSVRSVQGFNVFKAVDACKDLLERYGGHEYAAGVTLYRGNLERFKEKFEYIVSKTIDSKFLIPKQQIDIKISLSDINWKMFDIIKQMGPFGPGNSSPTFVTENVIATEHKILKDKHLKLRVKEIGGNTTFEVIGFYAADLMDKIIEKKHFSMVYKIQVNIYNNTKKLVLHLRDIKETLLVTETI